MRLVMEIKMAPCVLSVHNNDAVSVRADTMLTPSRCCQHCVSVHADTIVSMILRG